MEHLNIDAIYMEHPFLEGIFPRARVYRAYVYRWDEDLLDLSSLYMTWGFESIRVRKIFLLDKGGNIITRVGERKWLGIPLGTREENVREALARIGTTSLQVHYAVSILNDLCLLKLPRGFNNASEWQDSLIHRNREMIRQI